MRALTLWQPWAWAIAHAGKRIENRTWPPPERVVGKQIAIHAGKKLDKEDAFGLLDYLGEQGIDQPIEFTRSAIIAVATVKGWVEGLSDDHPQAMWFCGPCGWVLTDVIPLRRPVPCRGNRKLWDLPAEVEAQVFKELDEMRFEDDA